LLINVLCGVVSGVISSAIANPTDVLKVRGSSGRLRLARRAAAPQRGRVSPWLQPC